MMGGSNLANHGSYNAHHTINAAGVIKFLFRYEKFVPALNLDRPNSSCCLVRAGQSVDQRRIDGLR